MVGFVALGGEFGEGRVGGGGGGGRWAMDGFCFDDDGMESIILRLYMYDMDAFGPIVEYLYSTPPPPNHNPLEDFTRMVPHLASHALFSIPGHNLAVLGLAVPVEEIGPAAHPPAVARRAQSVR